MNPNDSLLTFLTPPGLWVHCVLAGTAAYLLGQIVPRVMLRRWRRRRAA